VKVKVIASGNSLAISLPKEAAQALKVERGDALYLTPVPGGYKLMPYDPEFEAKMEVARRIMKEDRDVLRELAK
jgi:putative addiction module antidote